MGLLRHAKSVLDGTVGGGGHAEALLEAGVPRVIGVDRDSEALAAARTRLEPFASDGRFVAYQSNYADLTLLPPLRNERFGGILLDLGVSSRQIDATERGFSFREGAPLDMRMQGSGDVVAGGRTAADVLNEDDPGTLAAIFRSYGDEPRAARLAREIVRRRERRPFGTSDDLVGAIRGALGPRTGPSDFARLFQAVRIAVNDEVGGLERALPDLRDRLEPGGVLAILTYHSGEDRVVKHAFRDWSSACRCPPRQPVCTCGGRALGETLTRKAISAREPEVAANPRARSARLRAWRRRSAA